MLTGKPGAGNPLARLRGARYFRIMAAKQTGLLEAIRGCSSWREIQAKWKRFPQGDEGGQHVGFDFLAPRAFVRPDKNV